MLLDREEYVEQAYFFRALYDRIQQNQSTQDLLSSIREELLATTRLPLAIDFMGSELRMTGGFATAMARLGHYFTKFQTFVIAAAENERSRFDFRVALEVLEREALYRSQSPTRPGAFLYQFEALCRNRLGYDKGLEAVAADPIYDDDWREWLQTVRQQIGFHELADLIYVRSEHYLQNKSKQEGAAVQPEKPVLFGVKEGKIAWANRRKDPVFLFQALQRHLHYPAVPRPKPPDESRTIIPAMQRRLERLEARVKLLEEEQRGGIDLSKFYGSGRPADGP